MDKKDEILSTNDSENELEPGVQALADMADKMNTSNSDERYNKKGFDDKGIHKGTGTKYDPDGYDADGFNRDGRDRAGYDRDGYDVKGFDRSGVDDEGFDRRGFGTDWRDRDGYNAVGRDKDGYDRLGFDKNGIHRITGEKYDSDGYDKNGYNKNGINRGGFDKFGYNEYGYDKKGFNKEGINKDGYNRSGFNEDGFNSEGVHISEVSSRFGKDGFDKNGVHFFTNRKHDSHGFNQDGLYVDSHTHYRSKYNPRGFDRDGYNIFTDNNLDLWGFDFDGVHSETGEKRDRYGFDANGLHSVGYYGPHNQYFEPDFTRDENGVDYRGFKWDEPINTRTGNKYDVNGFDIDGYNEEGRNINGFDRDGYNEEGIDKDGYGHDGFNADGIDRDGYDREGFDEKGIDREGYSREGLDKDGNTREFNAKFNEYGIDENGYMKNGEMDPDIEFALNFAESGFKDLNKYAAEKSMDEKEVRDRIKLARKKCPNINNIINDLLLTGNKMRMAAVSKDCDKFIGGQLNLDEFWNKHPRLTISEVLTNFINDPDKRKYFSDKTIEGLVLDSENIEKNLRIFGASLYDVSGALKGIDDFKKTYTKFGTDGSSEQIQKKRENTKKIFDTIKYFNRYKNRNLDSLLDSRQSFDGGETWIEYNGETIGRAMDALKKDKKLVCVQTVKDYIIKHNMEGNNE